MVVVASAIWVGFDARGRDWDDDGFADRPWKWVVGCLFLWIIVFPVYLARRNRPAANEAVASPPADRVQRVAVESHDPDGAPGVMWWGVASAVAMIVGAFGPWVHVLALSVSGTDGANDGWIVVGVAVVGLLCVFGRSRPLSLLSIALGLLGAGVTLYDRGNVSSAISSAGAFGAVASVGWGLNLALLGSASLAVQGAFAARAASRISESPELTSEVTISPPVGAPSLPPAGWYADPHDKSRLRYWAGQAWTGHTALLATPPVLGSDQPISVI